MSFIQFFWRFYSIHEKCFQVIKILARFHCAQLRFVKWNFGTHFNKFGFEDESLMPINIGLQEFGVDVFENTISEKELRTIFLIHDNLNILTFLEIFESAIYNLREEIEVFEVLLDNMTEVIDIANRFVIFSILQE